MTTDAASGATQEERAMSYGQGGYRQPDLRPGMPVQTDSGWAGHVVEVIGAPPGYDGTVRIAWQGYGETTVTLSSLTVENGVAWIRSQPPAPQQVAQPAVQHTMPLDATPDDMATQLAGPVRQPAHQEPTHVNPYAGNDPLVTDEPAPVHTAGRDQDMQHVNPLLIDQPVVAEEPPPVIPRAGGRSIRTRPSSPRRRDSSRSPTPTRPCCPPGVPPCPQAATSNPISSRTTIRAMPRCSRSLALDSAETVLSRPDDSARLRTGDGPRRAARSDRSRHRGTGRGERRVAGRGHDQRPHRDGRDSPDPLARDATGRSLFERVTVGRVLAEGEEVMQRDEDGVTIIPVIVEEAVVVTRRVLAEELRITKRTIPTVQTVQAVTRKERVEIDAGDLADRVHDTTGTDAANIPSQALRDDTA